MDLRKKVGMAKSFASSVVSRGIANKKTDKLTKQLRVISCFGNEHLGGELPPCEHLKNSNYKKILYRETGCRGYKANSCNFIGNTSTCSRSYGKKRERKRK